MSVKLRMKQAPAKFTNGSANENAQDFGTLIYFILNGLEEVAFRQADIRVGSTRRSCDAIRGVFDLDGSGFACP